ncbi:glutathione S-transferase theta-1-like [Musca domestica]|uniref:Glutathione S-transferase theta-1-like n=1 Tax=Musca domestica TaxID=7370 RepID=A0ABM3VC05_MUSDO|nr:glutathione S-transferase theta-1-like [Musca domestica]
MPMQPIKFYYDVLNQSSRALYILLEASKIPFEPVQISLLKGEHLTGEYRDKVTRFKRIPAINDHGFQLSESVAIFRHLVREKIVPEHWYPRKNLGRSRIDEYLEWRQRNLGVASTDYFQQKWLVPYLQKTRANESSVNGAAKQLERNLNDFENLFLQSNKFIIGDTISYADLLAICEVDQPKYIGYNPFIKRNKLSKWYDAVREELGPFYKDVSGEFESKLRTAEKGHNEVISMKQ